MEVKRVYNNEDEIPYFKDHSPFTVEEMDEIESKKRWKRSYIVKPYEYMLGYRKSRAHNRVDYPYISLNGLEILKLIAASKVLYRETVSDIIFFAPERSQHTQIQSAGKALKTVIDKEYVLRQLEPVTQSYAYGLGKLGKGFLDIKDADSRFGLLNDRYFLLNRLFQHLCKEFRGVYTLEWLVEPDWIPVELEADAVATQWDDIAKGKVRESSIFHILRSEFDIERAEEIRQLQQKYTDYLGTEINEKRFPTLPSVYVLNPDKGASTSLKVVDKGRPWAAEGQIQEWLAQ